ncbi:MAG: HEPN domain-containing protein [Proteobacteria bacterium]|nr:HEPN domain-containing protein [Pseudomonadota bacterium]
MTDREKQKALSLYRLTQAEESLDEARYLLAGGKPAIRHRIYYGMFYSILGLLIYEPYASSKHSGVLSYFNKRFIGEKIFPEQMGRTVHKAFDLRQRGDYREYQEIEPDQVGPLLEQADAFVRAVRQYLEKHIFIEEG